MPEVVTKHPDVVKQVLESAGARCGRGEPQKILTKCPPAQFCALPGGEVCIFGIDGISQMTQLTRAELCPARTEGPPAGTPGVLGGSSAAEGLLAAAVVGMMLRARWRR